MKSVYQILGRRNLITFSSGKHKINFDRVIRSGRVILLRMKTEKINSNDSRSKLTMKEVHGIVGHPNDNACITTAQKYEQVCRLR